MTTLKRQLIKRNIEIVQATTQVIEAFLMTWRNSPLDLSTPTIIIPTGKSNVELTTFVINGSSVTTTPELAEKLRKANAEMLAETGKEMQINSSLRSFEDQLRIYNNAMERKKQGYTTGIVAALPGTSRHERGLAVDIQNWKEAGKYLRKQGLDNRIANDEVHFQTEDMTTDLASREDN